MADPKATNRKKSSHPVDPAVVNRERGAFEGSVAQVNARQRKKGATAQPRGPPAEAATLEAIVAKLDAINAEPDAYSVINSASGIASACRCSTNSGIDAADVPRRREGFNQPRSCRRMASRT